MSVLGNLATWVFWAYYAAGFFVMGAVLTIHLIMVPMPSRAPWLLVVGAACGVAGAIVGGIQAGPYPMLEQHVGFALIRAFWLSGITLGIIASGLYLYGMRERQH